MRSVELSWETCRAVIDVLREKRLPYMRERADYLERQVEQHGPNEATVRLSLSDDLFLGSFNWAAGRWASPSRPDGKRDQTRTGPIPSAGHPAPAPTRVDSA